MKNLKIEQPYVAIFASGSSVLEMSKVEFETIKRKAFVITTNFGPVNFNGHLNCWSDRTASIFLEKHYSDKPKDCLFLSREAAFSPGMTFRSQVDHWFDNRRDNLQGNFTAGWALQLVRRHFPEKPILLFGYDFYVEEEKHEKWYDAYTDYDWHNRGANYHINKKLQMFISEMRSFHIDRTYIYNCNPKSQLDIFEKKDWMEVMGLDITHFANSSLAGAPVHLSQCFNKYSSCIRSKTVLRSEFRAGTSLSNLKWSYDEVSPGKETLHATVASSDIIHYHQKPYGVDAQGRPGLIQYHAQPGTYRPNVTDKAFEGRKLVIAQYHPRFYTDAYIVPNMIDIWAEQHLPGVKSRDKVKIFYSWASEVKGGWGDKGSNRTIAILKAIEGQYKDKVEVVIFNNQPYDKCLQEKQNAHICIDECVTGSYHLQSLEGCSAGAVTFNNIDVITENFLESVTGKKGHPFVKTNLDELQCKLSEYIDDIERLIKEGLAARQWMEENWDPRILVKRFEQSYFNLIRYNHVEEVKKENEFPVPVLTRPQHNSPSRPRIENSHSVQRRPNNIHNVNHTPKEKAPIVYEAFIPEKGRSYVELYKKYDGQDIYILGTGPSLLELDPELFKDKITLSINYAFEKVPYISYYLVHVIEAYHSIINEVPRDKLLLPENLVPQYFRDTSKIRYKDPLKPDCEEAIIYPIQNRMIRNLNDHIIDTEKQTRIFTWSTTTHSAIHLAAYMGARRILLGGVDYTPYPGGKVHFDTQLNPDFGTQDWSANVKHKQGDQWLAQQLRVLGIELLNMHPKIRY